MGLHELLHLAKTEIQNGEAKLFTHRKANTQDVWGPLEDLKYVNIFLGGHSIRREHRRVNCASKSGNWAAEEMGQGCWGTWDLWLPCWLGIYKQNPLGGGDLETCCVLLSAHCCSSEENAMWPLVFSLHLYPTVRESRCCRRLPFHADISPPGALKPTLKNAKELPWKI